MPVHKSDKSSTRDEIVLGIDYGETNIGLAFGRIGLTGPLDTISGKNTDRAISDIAKAYHDIDGTKIVIGLPLNANGKETSNSVVVRRFAKLLKIYLKQPIEFVNEYLTTQESVEKLVNQGMPQKSRRGGKKDRLSAELILKRYYHEKE